MRVYYLDRMLSPEEASWVGDQLDPVTQIEQIRIPHVLPASDPDGGHRDRPIIDIEALEPNLVRAGIRRDGGKQIAVVIPGDMHWYIALAQLVFQMTGFYPFLIQTSEHRENIGNPGGLRIMDMHGMLGGKNPEESDEPEEQEPS